MLFDDTADVTPEMKTCQPSQRTAENEEAHVADAVCAQTPHILPLSKSDTAVPLLTCDEGADVLASMLRDVPIPFGASVFDSLCDGAARAGHERCTAMTVKSKLEWDLMEFKESPPDKSNKLFDILFPPMFAAIFALPHSCTRLSKSLNNLTKNISTLEGQRGSVIKRRRSGAQDREIEQRELIHDLWVDCLINLGECRRTRERDCDFWEYGDVRGNSFGKNCGMSTASLSLLSFVTGWRFHYLLNLESAHASTDKSEKAVAHDTAQREGQGKLENDSVITGTEMVKVGDEISDVGDADTQEHFDEARQYEFCSDKTLRGAFISMCFSPVFTTLLAEPSRLTLKMHILLQAFFVAWPRNQM